MFEFTDSVDETGEIYFSKINNEIFSIQFPVPETRRTEY